MITSSIVDQIRVVMYSSDTNLLEELELLGLMLGEYDGVPYSPDNNRLTQALLFIKNNLPENWKIFSELNDE